MSEPDQAEVKAIWERQLHFVSGKGGVGKSVISCALAHRFHAEGLTTLLCQINARDSHSALLSRAGRPTVIVNDVTTEIEDGLFVVNINPRAALREYATMILKFDTVVRAVFDNRIARTFLRFVPALAELNMLGKIWFHACEISDQESSSRKGQKIGQSTGNEKDGPHARPRFDRIIVDAPSTGHGLSFLRVARVLHTLTHGRGPMAEKTRRMQALIEDPDRTALHVVTLAEELPCNEALEFVAQARSEKTAPLGLLIANMLQPLILTPFRNQLAASDPEKGMPSDAQSEIHGHQPTVTDDERRKRSLQSAVARRLGQENHQIEQMARLGPEQTGLPRAEVPLLNVNELSRAEISELAEALS